MSDENIFEQIYQLGRNGYVCCLPLYLTPFFCKKKWLLHQMQKSLALLSSSGNAEGELHSLPILYRCKITKSIDIGKFVAFIIYIHHFMIMVKIFIYGWSMAVRKCIGGQKSYTKQKSNVQKNGRNGLR